MRELFSEGAYQRSEYRRDCMIGMLLMNDVADRRKEVGL